MEEKAAILIRPEETRDFAAIREIHQLSFGRENEAAFVEKIRDSRGFIPGLSLVAEYEGRVAGHILFSRIWIRPADPKLPEEVSLALAPLAVHPDFRNKGLGSELVNQGLKTCLPGCRGYPSPGAGNQGNHPLSSGVFGCGLRD
jgi:predicted N-acetyltransferase YhbS